MRQPFTRRRRSVALSHLVALGPLACAEFASENDRMPTEIGQPSTLGSSAWDCTTSADVEDPLVYSQATSLALSLRPIDISTRSTPPNLKVRACLITDLDCQRPISGELSADADGILTVPLAIGVSGFLELTADGMAPALLVLPGPLSVELATLLGSRVVVLVPSGSGARDALPIRAQAMPDTGTLLATVLDCDGRGAAGVLLEIDTPSTPFSIIDGIPIMNQRTTTTYATVGFINVAPGVTVVSAYRVDTDEIVGRSAIPMRPGWDTLAYMLPKRGLEP